MLRDFMKRFPWGCDGNDTRGFSVYSVHSYEGCSGFLLLLQCQSSSSHSVRVALLWECLLHLSTLPCNSWQADHPLFPGLWIQLSDLTSVSCSSSPVSATRETFINIITVLKLLNGLSSLGRFYTNHLALSSPHNWPSLSYCHHSSSPGFGLADFISPLLGPPRGQSPCLSPFTQSSGVSLNVPL